MDYSHYWRVETDPFDDLAWARLCADTKRLFQASPERLCYLKMATRKAKLAKLLEIEGYPNDPWAFAEAFVTDSVCPAICMSDECDHTTELEPDQNQGYCDECHTNTMTSGLLLMGLV
jgi:hypothetical protein